MAGAAAPVSGIPISPTTASIEQRDSRLRPQNIHSQSLQQRVSEVGRHEQCQSFLVVDGCAEEVSGEEQASPGVSPASHHGGVWLHTGDFLG